MAGSGEYEPKDSRNVTGTASTPDGRWTNKDGNPPRADGESPDPRDREEGPEYEEDDEFDEDDEDEDDEGERAGPTLSFEPDPELLQMIEAARIARRREAEAARLRH